MPVTFNNQDEVQPYLDRVQSSANLTFERIQEIGRQDANALNAMEMLAHFKFDRIGHSPYSIDINGNPLPMNLMEQVNQTFTTLVSLKAVSFLNIFPITLNLGDANGRDIYNVENDVVAEVFAVVTGNSNDKLKEEIRSVAYNPHKLNAANKYIFCALGNDAFNSINENNFSYRSIDNGTIIGNINPMPQMDEQLKIFQCNVSIRGRPQCLVNVVCWSQNAIIQF